LNTSSKEKKGTNKQTLILKQSAKVIKRSLW